MNRREFLAGAAAGVLGAAVASVPVLASPAAVQYGTRMFSLMGHHSSYKSHYAYFGLTHKYTPDGIYLASMEVKDFLRSCRQAFKCDFKIKSFWLDFRFTNEPNSCRRMLALDNFTATELYELANGFFERYAETLAVRNVRIDNSKGAFTPSYF